MFWEEEDDSASSIRGVVVVSLLVVDVLRNLFLRQELHITNPRLLDTRYGLVYDVLQETQLSIHSEEVTINILVVHLLLLVPLLLDVRLVLLLLVEPVNCVDLDKSTPRSKLFDTFLVASKCVLIFGEAFRLNEGKSKFIFNSPLCLFTLFF